MKTMMRSILLPTLLALFIPLSGCEQESLDLLLVRAEQAIAKGEYRAATIDLKSALRKQVNNVRARWLLSEVYLAVQDGASAEKELKRARALGVEDDSVLPALAHALMLQGKHEEVLAIPLEVTLSPEASADLIAFRALALLETGELEAAAAALRTTDSARSGSNFLALAKARMRVERADLPGAIGALDALVKRTPKFAPAWSLRGEVLRQQQRYAEAESAYTTALAQRTYPVPDLVKRGYIRISLKRWDALKEDSETLQQIAPKSHVGHFFAGLLHYKDGEYLLAQGFLDTAHRLSPRDFLTLFLLASTDAALGNTQRARQLATQAVTMRPRFPPARMLMASMHLADEDGVAAEEMVRPLVDVDYGDTQAEILLAASLLQQGKTAEAAALFRNVADHKGVSPNAQLKAGLGLLSSGDPYAAIGVLGRVVDDRPNDALANRALITGFVGQRSREQALAAAQRFVERTPGDPTAMVVLAETHLALGEREKSRELFAQVLRVDPINLKALQFLAADALSNEDPEQALAYTERALSLSSNNYLSLVLKARAANATGDLAAEERALLKAIEAQPDKPESRAMLAQLYLQQDEAEKALSALPEGQNDKDPRISALRADIYYRLNRLNDAKRGYEALAEANPDAIDLQFRLTEIYYRLGESHNIEAAMKRVLDVAPNDLRALQAKTMLDINAGRFGAARRLLARPEMANMTDSRLLSLWVALAHAEGDHATEVDYARQLFEHDPNLVHLVTLSRAHRHAGDTERGKRVLEEWLADHPRDLGALFELAETQIGAGDDNTVQSTLRKMLDADPNNVYAHNNLAWFLLRQSPRIALRHARAAHEQAPNAAPITDTLAMAYAENDDLDNAIRFIGRAIDADPDKVVYRLHRAEIRLKRGDLDGTVGDLRDVLDGNPAEDVEKRAEALMKQIVGNDRSS